MGFTIPTSMDWPSKKQNGLRHAKPFKLILQIFCSRFVRLINFVLLEYGPLPPRGRNVCFRTRFPLRVAGEIYSRGWRQVSDASQPLIIETRSFNSVSTQVVITEKTIFDTL